MNVLSPIAWCTIFFVLGCAFVVFEVFIPSGGILGFFAGVFIIGSKYWPYTPMGRAFLGELPDEAEVAPQEFRRELIGKVGVARSKMLPSGAIEIDGNMYDAVTRGVAIEPGQRVVVSEVKGNRVVVRPAADNEQPRPSRPDDVLSMSSASSRSTILWLETVLWLETGIWLETIPLT
jgi:membrane-bound serine protease (ClpP class)